MRPRLVVPVAPDGSVVLSADLARALSKSLAYDGSYALVDVCRELETAAAGAVGPGVTCVVYISPDEVRSINRALERLRATLRFKMGAPYV